VEVCVDQVDDNVRIRIIDTGEGIAPELLPHIFDRFRQADSSTRRLHGGLGLGLAIVRSLVELHGGQVAAQSTGPGHGATFSVTLPLVGALADAYLPQPREDSESDGLSNLRLLVLDDNKDAARCWQACCAWKAPRWTSRTAPRRRSPRP
jgi:hypothetical protein